MPSLLSTANRFAQLLGETPIRAKDIEYVTHYPRLIDLKAFTVAELEFMRDDPEADEEWRVEIEEHLRTRGRK